MSIQWEYLHEAVVFYNSSFSDVLNERGAQGWEMIGYERQVGGANPDGEEIVYIMMWKRMLPVDEADYAEEPEDTDDFAEQPTNPLFAQLMGFFSPQASPPKPTKQEQQKQFEAQQFMAQLQSLAPMVEMLGKYMKKGQK